MIILSVFPLTSFAKEWVYGKVDKLEEYGGYDISKYQVLITLRDQEWPEAVTGGNYS